LIREFEKRDKHIKEYDKAKKQLEIIKEKRKKQERLIKGYPIRRKELDNLEN
jgi:hypothetical protein